MLEVKNLSKVYSGKGGVTVKALDDVSVVFPETGMVFLLGKSGSGKSTLLNVCGGLDKPDDGEIIVKGKSSKDFSASDFDSYRNTFIGFVFQEYNILNEFTIEQNIALALQLQSKPNDKAAVAALLEQVDLAGYAKRKPNTLSGGQKQRVAIARALIKEPEIIMADEPTGALDSATGKQVLDTLKKLSEHKLVIVVSHDREFAEQYGDRIIELKDGKIISDVTKVYNAPKDITGEDALKEEELPNVALVSEDTIAIRKGEELTDDDIRKIAEMLRSKGGEAIITTDEHDLPGVKRACKINENGDKESFKETVPPTPVEYDGSKTKFIKSRLPLGHAIKMGASGLKSKPIRLIFTILLAVAAFVLFGVVSTFMLYDPNYSVSEALKETGYQNLLLDKNYTYVRSSYRVNYDTGEETLDYTYEGENPTLFTAKDVESKSQAGLKFAGVYTFNNTFSFALVKDGDTRSIVVARELADYYCATSCMGFTDCGETYLLENGFTINGRYPTAPNEIMISNYFAELFVNTDDNGISAPADLLGKQLRMSGYVDTPFTITGIVNTGSIPAKYEELKKSGTLNQKEYEALKVSFADYLSHGFETLFYVSAGFYDTYEPVFNRYNYGGSTAYINSQYLRKIRVERYYVQNWGMSAYTDKTLAQNEQLLIVHNLDGSVRSDRTINENEVVISKNRYNEWINNYLNDHSINPIYDAEALEELGRIDNSYKYDLTDKERATMIANGKKWYSLLAFRENLYNLASDYCLYGRLSNAEYENQYNLNESERSFLQGFENKTEEDDLVALEAYVTAHEQLYYGMVMERMMNNIYGWEKISETEDSLAICANLKNESYSAADFADVKAALDAWFTDRGISMAVADRFTFDSKASDYWNARYYVMPSADKAAFALIKKIKNYVESFYYEKSEEEEAVPAATDADWDALYAYVKEQRPQMYYGWLVNYLNNQHQENRYREPDKDEWTLVDNLKNENYSEEEFAAMKERIDAWIDSLGASKDASENFVFAPDSVFTDLHYINKYGNRGTLKIIGYVAENMNSDYCLSDAFVKANAERDSEGYYETYQTDFVQPLDAKYNRIISLTDNSMSQISAALTKEGSGFYEIDNGVVEEMNRFLDMITELGEIFLYVGLGVGVLAAFFLLNFISVSISTKRKDIGILRAVGARGSDVFKIFYAEAFLIAFICFVLASVGSFFLCFFLNRTISETISLRLLNFGPINIALIFGISVFVSVIATFLPVFFAAKKSPVESIRAL